MTSIRSIQSNPQPAVKVDPKMWKAAKDFESIMLQKMFESMQKTVPKSGLLKSGFADSMYSAMFAKNVAESGTGNMGIAKSIYNQFTQNPSQKIK